jgi:hypothetical protein
MGFGQVYRATYDNRPVAVKILNLLHDMNAAARFVSFLVF